MKKFIFKIIILALLVSGCVGQHCIKIGGAYDGVTGNIEYCFDEVKTKELSAPVINSSNGEQFFGISEKEAQKIIDTIEDQDQSTKIETKVKEPPFQKLKRLIK